MDAVLEYHEQSKHHPNRLADGPDQLDWEQQPEPFRTYVGAPRLPLPLVADELAARFNDLYALSGGVPIFPMNFRGIAAFLELTLGLSAWKGVGTTRWALRCNPSSGNLHPLEGYMVVPDLSGVMGSGELAAGVYHYVSRDHVLEQRCSIQDPMAWNRLFGPHSFVFGLTAMHARTTWKYGDRSYRYCQLDLGHAMAAMRFAAAALGWQARLLTGVATFDVGRLLGVSDLMQPKDRFDHTKEPEHPGCLMQISLPERLPFARKIVVGSLIEHVIHGPWMGEANRLSNHPPRAWPRVEAIARAVWQPEQPEEREASLLFTPSLIKGGDLQAAVVIRQRRSGQAYDDQGWMDQAVLWRMLDALLPRMHAGPWDLLPWEPRIHLVLMVHRVRGLSPGLYALVRRPAAMSALQAAMHASFSWTQVAETSGHLPLYLLQEGDLREIAKVISCQQEIAGDSALSLGMVAEFASGLSIGPWGYPRMFWEAGMVGQTLYLEAEAGGMRGTGIGCHFDDLFHQLLGLRSGHFQSLYHFTIGVPILDARLRLDPPYELD